MLKKSMTKNEIEEILAKKGDYVKIDLLTRFLNESPPINTKKLVLLKLAEIYENIGMLKEAAKTYDDAGMISIAFTEKIKHFIKETELYIKAGNFDRADEAMKKAISEANAVERQEIYFTVKDFYKKQAGAHERSLKRFGAVRIYEKLLEMNLTERERKDIKEKLLPLYEKLGKTDKAKRLKTLN